MTTSADQIAPAAFQAALEQLTVVRIRPEIELGELPAPTRLAPLEPRIVGVGGVGW